MAGLMDRRGATALMFGVMAPAMVGMAAMVVDTGFWMVASTRLQMAADAGALGVYYLLGSSAFKSMTTANQLSTAQSVALYEAQAAAPKLVGTMQTPLTVAYDTTAKTATVTIQSQAGTYFLGAFGIQPPLIRVSATVGSGATPRSCVLALGTTGNAITLDNTGTINATNCPVTSDSGIYLNTGTISATAINVVTALSTSNSGGNTTTPSTATTVSAEQDPYASKTAPAASNSCTTPNYSSYSPTPYNATPGTFCGSTTIGGNGSSINFAPGVYIVKGDLTFTDVVLNSAATGVTFVVQGNLSWTNNSNSSPFQFSAPTSGPTAGVVFWQPCAASQTTTFTGGSTMVLSGSIYAPCSAAEIKNNATLAGLLNTSFDFVSKTLHVWGSSTLRTSSASGSSGSGSGGTGVLTQ